MGKKSILIGGSGFIGTHVAKGLLSAGYDVTIVDKKQPQYSIFGNWQDVISFHKIDFHDNRRLKALVKGKDLLLHFAYSSLPGNSMTKMEEDIMDNTGETVRLLRLAVENGVGKVVFPSSGGTVYGNSEKLPIKEDFPTNPICSHGITKLAIEKYLYLFNKIFSLDYLIYRIANPYGPGQRPDGEQGLVANVMGRMLRGEEITVFGKGENVRDYIYIDDVVKAFTLGVKSDLKNDIFNIGTGKGHSINEIVKLVSDELHIKPRIRCAGSRVFDVRSSVLNSGKIKKAAEWEPEVGLEEGISKTHAWIRRSEG